MRAIRRTGLHLNDIRLIELRTNLDDCQNFLIEHIDDSDYDCGIDFDCFKVIKKFLSKENFREKLLFESEFFFSGQKRKCV